MSRQKIEDKNVRKLSRIGNKSIGLTLPIDLVRELKWREKQKVVVKRVRGGFIKIKNHMKLENIFIGFRNHSLY